MSDERRRVLVTGASGGIGRAIAVALAEAAFDVDVHYHRGDAAAKQTLDACRAAGAQGESIAFDVADRAATEAALRGAVAERGPYWGVVCNAGIHEDAAFPAMRPEAWDRVLDTNLGGFYNVLHPLVMPMVRAHDGGRIVSVSSVAALMGNRGQVNYAASKAGLIGATKALSHELARRAITVNAVAPGLIDTEMVDDSLSDAARQLVPMRRLGTAAEVGAVVAFLFSEGASYVTGQVISVNGGMA